MIEAANEGDFEFRKNKVEILPLNFGDLTQKDAGLLLDRAANRLMVIYGKTNEYWNGVIENFRGFSLWIKAHESMLKRKSMKVVYGSTLIATMLSACSPAVSAVEPVSMASDLGGAGDRSFENAPEMAEVKYPPAVAEAKLTPEPADTYHAFDGPVYEYDQDSQVIVDAVQEEYGMRVTMPKEYDGIENKRWDAHQIGYIADALSKLPPYYFESGNVKEIILLMVPGSTNGDAGGGYTSGRLKVYIPEGYKPEEEYVYKAFRRLYGKKWVLLESVVAHEFTHSLPPDVQERWNQAMGWIQITGPDGKSYWINIKTEELQKLVYANGHPENPQEDMAVSVQQMMADPKSLPDDRYQFLSTAPEFQGLGSFNSGN